MKKRYRKKKGDYSEVVIKWVLICALLSSIDSKLKITRENWNPRFKAVKFIFFLLLLLRKLYALKFSVIRIGRTERVIRSGPGQNRTYHKFYASLSLKYKFLTFINTTLQWTEAIRWKWWTGIGVHVEKSDNTHLLPIIVFFVRVIDLPLLTTLAAKRRMWALFLRVVLCCFFCHASFTIANQANSQIWCFRIAWATSFFWRAHQSPIRFPFSLNHRRMRSPFVFEQFNFFLNFTFRGKV